MAWLSTIFESLPKALIFGGLLFWIVVTNTGVGARVVGVALIGLLAAIVLGRVFDRFGLPKALFMTVWRPSTRSAEHSCGIRQG